MRDKIFVDYGFDFYDDEHCNLVFFETDTEKLQPFQVLENAEKFCEDMLQRGVHSLLVIPRGPEIECKLYK